MLNVVIIVILGVCCYGGVLAYIHEWKLRKLEKELQNVSVLVSIESEKRRKIEAEIDEIRGENEAKN